jgi:hypothetical protein
MLGKRSTRSLLVHPDTIDALDTLRALHDRGSLPGTVGGRGSTEGLV